MPEHTTGKLWIGTSNVILPGKKTTFPTEFQMTSRLRYYSTLFNSVEMNSTFYKIPMTSTFEKWSQDVGDAFRFTIKFLKSITHVKDLQFDETDIEKFLSNAHFLHNKKGCLLLQFPGKITLNYFNQVERILKLIAATTEAHEWNIAVELRNASLHTGETMELLDAYHASMVLHDFPKGKNMELHANTPIHYLRFHGPTGNYRGSYSYTFLQQKAAGIQALLDAGKDVYAYFNNTAGDAYQNAQTLQALSEGARK